MPRCAIGNSWPVSPSSLDLGLREGEDHAEETCFFWDVEQQCRRSGTGCVPEGETADRISRNAWCGLWKVDGCRASAGLCHVSRRPVVRACRHLWHQVGNMWHLLFCLCFCFFWPSSFPIRWGGLLRASLTVAFHSDRYMGRGAAGQPANPPHPIHIYTDTKPDGEAGGGCHLSCIRLCVFCYSCGRPNHGLDGRKKDCFRPRRTLQSLQPTPTARARPTAGGTLFAIKPPLAEVLRGCSTPIAPDRAHSHSNHPTHPPSLSRYDVSRIVQSVVYVSPEQLWLAVIGTGYGVSHGQD